MAIIRIARLWPGAERAAAAAAPAIVSVDVDPILDSLDAFGSEAIALPFVQRPVAVQASLPAPAPAPEPALEPAPEPVDVQSVPTARSPRDWTTVRHAFKWVAVVVVSATATAAGAWEYQRRTAPPSTGVLTIQTTPAGLAVGIDGRSAGVTPMTLTLPAASYAVQVGDGLQRRDLTVSVTAGSSVLQHLELPSAPSAAPPTGGSLLVQTDPPGQSVSVDGVDRGASPLTVSALSVGHHAVVVRGSRGIVKRTVQVKEGETVSLILSPVAPAIVAPGWLSVQSSVRLDLREHGKLIGTTETEQLMLPAGEHTIDVSNEAIGFRSQRQIQVASGKVTTVSVDMPYGAMSLNAQPWAEVWINGERIGETPIANLSRRIGSYEVVFRHPDLGERRETLTVTLRQTARLGVDMRGKQR